jgi:hypothetical protein
MSPVVYYEKDASGGDRSEREIVPKEQNNDSRDRQVRDLAAYQDAVPPSFLGGGFQSREDEYADENGGRARVKTPVMEIYTDHHPHELDDGIRH